MPTMHVVAAPVALLSPCVRGACVVCHVVRNVVAMLCPCGGHDVSARLPCYDLVVVTAPHVVLPCHCHVIAMLYQLPCWSLFLSEQRRYIACACGQVDWHVARRRRGAPYTSGTPHILLHVAIWPGVSRAQGRIDGGQGQAAHRKWRALTLAEQA